MNQAITGGYLSSLGQIQKIQRTGRSSRGIRRIQVDLRVVCSLDHFNHQQSGKQMTKFTVADKDQIEEYMQRATEWYENSNMGSSSFRLCILSAIAEFLANQDGLTLVLTDGRIEDE